MNKFVTLLMFATIMTSCSFFAEKGAGNWIKSVSLGTPSIEFWIIRGEPRENSYLFKVNAIGASGEHVINQYSLFLSRHYDTSIVSKDYNTKILVEVESINSVSLDAIINVTQKYFSIQKVEYNSIQNWIIIDVRKLI